MVTDGNKPRTGNTNYPPDYGNSCQKHNEIGSTSCWDQTTGKEFSTTCTEDQTAGTDSCKAGWCSQSWCYIDPCTCDKVNDAG